MWPQTLTPCGMNHLDAPVLSSQLTTLMPELQCATCTGGRLPGSDHLSPGGGGGVDPALARCSGGCMAGSLLAGCKHIRIECDVTVNSVRVCLPKVFTMSSFMYPKPTTL